MNNELILQEDYEELDHENDIGLKYLVFHSAGKDFATPIKYVTEIVTVLPITEVPNMPEYILGIINLRGKGVPIIDSRLKLCNEKNISNSKDIVIIFNVYDEFFGLVACGIREVLNINQDQIQYSKTLEYQEYLYGFSNTEKSLLILLDIEKLYKSCFE